MCGCLHSHSRSLERGGRWGGFDPPSLVPPLYSGEIAQEVISAIRVCDHKVLAICVPLLEVTCEMTFRKTHVMWSLPLWGARHLRQLVSKSGWVKIESLLKWDLAYFRFYSWLQGGVFYTVLIRLRCAELWKDVLWRVMVLVLLGSFWCLDASIGQGWRVEQFHLLSFFQSKQFNYCVSV